MGVPLLLVLPPPVEPADVGDVVGDTGVEDVEDPVLVDEDVPPAGPVLHGAHLGDALGVAGDEGVMCIPLAPDQGVEDEQLARHGPVDPVEVDGPPLDDGQGAEADPLDDLRRPPIGVPAGSS